MKPSFLNFLLDKARQIIAPDDDQVQAEIDQIVPRRAPNPLSAIPGYAGGNLGQQLNPMIAPRPERADEFAPSDTIRPQGSFGGDAPPVESITRPGVTPQPLSTPNAVPATEPSIKPITPQLPLPDRNPALTSAREGFDDARNQPLTFGTDKSGNTRYAPEKGFMGRLKAGGKIFAQGGGLPGLIQGAISPELPAKMRRSRLIGEAGQNLQTEMGVAREQSQIEENQAQADRYSKMPLPASPESAQQERERDNLRAAWQAIVTSGQEFDPNNAEHKQIHDRAQGLGMPLPYGTKYIRPGAERMEVTGPNGEKLNLTHAEAASYLGQVGRREEAATEKQSESERQRLAAQDEFDQATADERAAGEEKDRAYKYLEGLKSDFRRPRGTIEVDGQVVADPKDPDTTVTEEDIREATKAAEAANVFYRSFADKKRIAKGKASRHSVRPQAQKASPYAGKVMNAASMPAWAKERGFTLPQAQQALKDAGVRVQ